MNTPKLIDDLRAILGADNLLCGEALVERSNGYWDPSPPRAKAIVLPHSTEQVSKIMSLCHRHRHRQSVVVQGGLTGAVEGQSTGPGDIGLSLERMNQILHCDIAGRTLRVEAGCTLHQVQEYAASRNLLFALDIGARGSCTIGGNIATNAGGMEVIRYGSMREQVLGLELVLANGQVLNAMNQMRKNNAGFDLKQFFIGSEGVLGIVTQAVLRLRPQTASRDTALLCCRDFSQVIEALHSAEESLAGTLSRFEFMDGAFYRFQTQRAGHRAPLGGRGEWYALVETRGVSPDEDSLRLQLWLETLFLAGSIADATLADTRDKYRRLWQLRENFDALIANKPYFLYDISLPIAEMENYLCKLRSALHKHWPDSRLYTLGHIGDGNLHFFLLPNAPGEVGALKSVADELVYAPLAHIGGSISAEHGIGLEKKPWLHLSRSTPEIALMVQLKKLFDPDNILNPGRVVDMDQHY